MLVARGHTEPRRLDDRPAAACRLQELEAERTAPPIEQLELTGRTRALLLEPLDLRQLRLRLLGLALLVTEPLDEPLEPCDVGADALRRPRGRGCARGL